MPCQDLLPPCDLSQRGRSGVYEQPAHILHRKKCLFPFHGCLRHRTAEPEKLDGHIHQSRHERLEDVDAHQGEKCQVVAEECGCSRADGLAGKAQGIIEKPGMAVGFDIPGNEGFALDVQDKCLFPNRVGKRAHILKEPPFNGHIHPEDFPRIDIQDLASPEKDIRLPFQCLKNAIPIQFPLRIHISPSSVSV